jgi:hypothetical protein
VSQRHRLDYVNKCKQYGPCRILLPATTDATSESIRASSSFLFTRGSPYQYRYRHPRSEHRKPESKPDDFNPCREARRRRGIGCVSRRFGGGFGGACVVFEESDTVVRAVFFFPFRDSMLTWSVLFDLCKARYATCEDG